MKLITMIAATLILLISCTKQIDKPALQPQNISASNDVGIFQFSGTFIIDETDFDSCNNEYIHVTGYAPFRGQFLGIRDKMNTIKIDIIFHLRAIGLTTGTNYVGNGSYSAFVKEDWDLNLEIDSEVQHIIFTSPLETEDLTEHINIKNENVQLEVNNVNFTFNCNK